MMTHKQIRAAAMARPEVKAEFAALADEYALLDEFLKARAAQGLTQAQVAQKRNNPVCAGSHGIWTRKALAVTGNAIALCGCA